MVCISIVISLLLMQFVTDMSECAPTNSNNQNTKTSPTNHARPMNFLRGLFRRQTQGSSSNSQSSNQKSNSNPTESEADDAMTQTELDAQKFMDSLPNSVSIIKV